MTNLVIDTIALAVDICNIIKNILTNIYDHMSK